MTSNSVTTYSHSWLVTAQFSGGLWNQIGALSKESVSRKSKFGNFKQESVSRFFPPCVLILALKPEGRTTECLRFFQFQNAVIPQKNLHHGYAESKGNTSNPSVWTWGINIVSIALWPSPLKWPLSCVPSVQILSNSIIPTLVPSATWGLLWATELEVAPIPQKSMHSPRELASLLWCLAAQQGRELHASPRWTVQEAWAKQMRKGWLWLQWGKEGMAWRSSMQGFVEWRGGKCLVGAECEILGEWTQNWK